MNTYRSMFTCQQCGLTTDRPNLSDCSDYIYDEECGMRYDSRMIAVCPNCHSENMVKTLAEILDIGVTR